MQDDAALWFVDIHGGAVHRYDPATEDRRSIPVGGRPSFLARIRDGGLLVGDGHALRRLENDALGEPVAMIDMPAGNRANDATVDRSVRLWFGTMDEGERAPTGAVYVFAGAGLRIAGGACVITNGPAVSPDGRTLYHVDTLAGTIWRFDIDGRETLTDGDVLVHIAPSDGFPDGASVDAAGCLWVGLWGGWAARRYAPDGTLLASIALPCENVTEVAFGGPGLRTGFVATARRPLGSRGGRSAARRRAVRV